MDSIVNLIVGQLATNPLVQGAIVSLVVAKLREVFAGMDAAAKDPSQVKNVQFLVAGLSLLATLGTAWSTGHLSNLDPQLVTNFVTTLVGALAAHTAGQDVKRAVAEVKKK